MEAPGFRRGGKRHQTISKQAFGPCRGTLGKKNESSGGKGIFKRRLGEGGKGAHGLNLKAPCITNKSRSQRVARVDTGKKKSFTKGKDRGEEEVNLDARVWTGC